ncbi:hypothetical protein D3C80_389110 [compost metagenome]
MTIGQRPVQLLEIKGVIERLAQFRVLELLPAHVRHEGLHDADGTIDVRQLFLLDAALLDGRKIITGDPAAGGGFLPEIDGAGLEGLKVHILIGKEGVGDGFEIIHPHIHIDVLAPVVVAAFIGDCGAGRD